MGDMGEQSWPDGRYVKLGSADNVALISDPLANLEPKPEQWLNKTFFRVEKPKAISVAFPAETNSWKLTRETETARWKLADAKPGEQLDATKTSGVSNPFGSASFTDVTVGAKPEEWAGQADRGDDRHVRQLHLHGQRGPRANDTAR